MGVIEAEASGLWIERYAPLAMGRNERRAFFGRAVHIGGNMLAVPMQLLGGIGVVVNVDDCLLAFLEAEKRPRKLSVVGGSGDDAIWSNLDRRCFDVEGVVGVNKIAWRGSGTAALCN